MKTKTGIIILAVFLAFVIAVVITASIQNANSNEVEEAKCNTCYNSRTITCEKCRGKGKELCESCYDHKYLGKCYFCEGTGEEEDFVKCSTCEGKGVIINPLTWQTFKCTPCNGIGYVYVYEECDYCTKGDGLCIRCKGTGLAKNAKNCVSCSGSGEITCPDCGN